MCREEVEAGVHLLKAMAGEIEAAEGVDTEAGMYGEALPEVRTFEICEQACRGTYERGTIPLSPSVTP